MTLGKSRLASVARRKGVLVAFVLLVAFMFAATSTFGTYQNLINVLQQNSIIGIIACGMTFAIILGGFDLSVGSVTALASVVGATIMIDLGTPGIPIGIIGAVAACLFVGATNGWLIAYLGVNPFVATLGTMTVVRGLIYVATNASPRFGVPYSFTTLGMGRLFGVPNPAIVFLIVAASLGFVLHRTRFGHYVYAVGGNPVASAQMGVNAARVRFAVYVLVSLCAAISGVILVGQTASATPQAALGYELTAIAAVIVGGAPLGGGRGRMSGTIVGVFLLGVVANGLKDLVLLTPSGDGIIPGIKLVNDAKIPIIEVNNKAGFGKSEANVLTYVGADDVEFGRLQGKLLDQAFGGKKAKVAYVMGIAGTSPQILRAKGWDEFRAKNPQYEEVARVNDDFDAAKALAAVQDLLSRFPKGQLDAIIVQGPEVGAAVDFALRNGRDEIKFIAGDYDQNVRQLIHDGKVFGTVDQDPYPQAYNAMKMAWLHFNGKDADIPKPNFLPLPLVTKENAEKTPAAWGCD